MGTMKGHSRTASAQIPPTLEVEASPPSFPSFPMHGGHSAWWQCYSSYGELPHSELKRLLEAVDGINCNAYAMDSWLFVETWARFIAGMDIYPHTPLRCPGDISKEIALLTEKYNQRSWDVGLPYFMGRTSLSLVEESMLMLVRTVQAPTQPQYHMLKCHVQGQLRQYVSNGMESVWLDVPSSSSAEWVMQKLDGSSRVYVSDGACSLWLDEVLPPPAICKSGVDTHTPSTRYGSM